MCFNTYVVSIIGGVDIVKHFSIKIGGDLGDSKNRGSAIVKIGEENGGA